MMDKDGTEWFNDTNKIIRGYNLRINGVKELLLAVIFSGP